MEYLEQTLTIQMTEIPEYCSLTIRSSGISMKETVCKEKLHPWERRCADNLGSNVR